MITSTPAVILLPAYTKRYLPESITTRPVQGEVPTLHLVLAYHKANNSPILRLHLSRVGKLVGAAPSRYDAPLQPVSKNHNGWVGVRSDRVNYMVAVSNAQAN